MLSSSWRAPAGFLGEESADVRPQVLRCATVRPHLGGPVVRVPGTGVPSAGLRTEAVAARYRATGLPTTGMPVAKQFAPTTQQFAPITQNGTTLGYRSSRRPPS